MELTINNQYGKRPWPGDVNSHNPSAHPSSLMTDDSLNVSISNLTSSSSLFQTLVQSDMQTTRTHPLMSHHQPVKRVANERERTRTASVNDAFIMLRSLIPTEPINRKLSKIETLRLASSYISHLHAVLVTGSTPTDQPCLHQHHYLFKHNNNNNNVNNNSTTNRSVCTFCVTELKQHQQKSMWEGANTIATSTSANANSNNNKISVTTDA